MRTAARIFLLLTGILLLAHYLPAGYWLIAARPQRPPFVFYSCVEQRFLLFRSGNGEVRRTDPAGNIYEREDFERLLPLDNYQQLYKDGRMPREINGVAVTPEKLRRDRVNLRLKAVALDSPSVALYPLIESASGRVRLEMPGDVMRLSADLEFLDVKRNTILADKTARFRQAFTTAGFVFPATVVGGNPSTLKPYDEGYFITDATGGIFHLRQEQGEPVLVKISDVVPADERARWTALKPRHIHVQEQGNREIRALIVESNGPAYLVIGPDYRLVTLPLQNYDPSTMNLSVRGDMLNRLVTVSSDVYVEAVALNRDYSFADRYIETATPVRDRPAGRLARALFPFTLDFEDDNSGFLGFHIKSGSHVAWWINSILLLAHAAWLLARKQLHLARWPDMAAVALGGVYGFLLALLLPRTG